MAESENSALLQLVADIRGCLVRLEIKIDELFDHKSESSLLLQDLKSRVEKLEQEAITLQNMTIKERFLYVCGKNLTSILIFLAVLLWLIAQDKTGNIGAFLKNILPFLGGV